MSDNLHYQLGPFLLITSQRMPLLLPALTPVPQGSGGIPVAVRMAPVPPAPEGAGQATRYVWAWPQHCLLAVPGTGRFLARAGCEVLVELAPEAPAADVQSYLLGWCFGALCHQNGMLPLHSCVVGYGGGAAAFLGDSGAGKSTLLASLSRAGYPVLADDVGVLAPEGPGLRLQPYGGLVKLWQSSLDFLGQPADEAQRTFADDDKFRVALPGLADGVAVPPLRRLLVLERAAGDEPELFPLAPAAAISAMLDNVYLGYCTEAMGLRPRLFAQCALVLQEAQAYRLRVPWGFEHVARTVAFLKERVLR